MAEFCPACRTERVGALRFCRSCGFDFDAAPAPSFDSSTPVANPAPAMPAPSTPGLGTTASPKPIVWAGAIIIAGGALAILGSFLPWVTATAAFVGTIGRNGIDGGGDGMFTIIAGIIAALCGIALLARSGRAIVARVGALICAAGLGYIFIIDLGNVNERISSIDTDFATASVGAGLYVVGLAAVLLVAGGLFGIRSGNQA
jgi:hypothetical protein